MTVANYNTSISNNAIKVNYTGRDGSIRVVKMINQETKKVYFLDFVKDISSVEIDIRPLIDDNVNKDNTFSLILLDISNNSIYRDILVFDGRVDNVSDYKQDEETNTGYVFG